MKEKFNCGSCSYWNEAMQRCTAKGDDRCARLKNFAEIYQQIFDERPDLLVALDDASKTAMLNPDIEETVDKLVEVYGEDVAAEKLKSLMPDLEPDEESKAAMIALYAEALSKEKKVEDFIAWLDVDNIPFREELPDDLKEWLSIAKEAYQCRVADKLKEYRESLRKRTLHVRLGSRKSENCICGFVGDVAIRADGIFIPIQEERIALPRYVRDFVSECFFCEIGKLPNGQKKYCIIESDISEEVSQDG